MASSHAGGVLPGNLAAVTSRWLSKHGFRCVVISLVLAASSIVASGCKHGAQDASVPPTSIEWHDCNPLYQCADLKVPMDYDHPSVRSMGISLIRRRAGISSERVGSLLLNPGGPGGSGVRFVLAADKIFPSEILDRFDIVGFDPRGVGRSTPVH